MLLEFIYMSSLPFVTTVITEKLWGKNGTGRSLKNQ